MAASTTTATQDKNRPRQIRNWCTIGICGAVSLSLACAPKFEETYYVGVFEKNADQPLQLYRFTMKGHADFGSKVKYESGWFRADALEAAVGGTGDVATYYMTAGYSTNSEHSNTRTTGANTTQPASGSNEPGDVVYVVGPEGKGQVLRDRRLVIFMAVDPSPITNAIQSFAQNLDTQLSTALITAKREQDEKAAAKKELRQQRLRTVLTSLKTNLQTAGGSGPQLADLIDKILLPEVNTMSNSGEAQP